MLNLIRAKKLRHYPRKFLLATIIITIISFFPDYLIFAQQENNSTNFIADFEVKYTVLDSGVCLVTQNISITNQTVDYYLKNYSLSLGVQNVSNITVTDNYEQNIPFSVKKENGNTLLELMLEEGVVGVGNTNFLIIKYQTREIAEKKGMIWEIVIPKRETSVETQSYNLLVKVPESFGPPTDKPNANEPGYYVYSYNKQDLVKSGYILNFGAYQYYEFNITYAINNPNLFTEQLSVTLPPSIPNVQKVFFNEITPRPVKTELDSDGNNIAYFSVTGGKTLHAQVTGKVMVFSNINELSSGSSEPNGYTGQDTYWETLHESLITKAKELKTARGIYNFITTSIKYNDVLPNESLTRKGALYTLRNKEGVCTEFADLFVALSRINNISTQMLTGYAYTGEPSQPLVTRNNRVVLHNWVRYWDQQKGWQHVDPTWGATTGLDYFNKFDTNHVVFAINGTSSTLPYSAGAYIEGNEELHDTVDVKFANNDSVNSMFTFEDILTKDAQQKSLFDKFSVYAIAIFVAVVVVSGTVFLVRKL